jgi:hypothetical protein
VEQELAERPDERRRPVGRSQHPARAPSDRLIDEIGDLLFTVVNLARKAGVEPGSRWTGPTGSSGSASSRSRHWPRRAASTWPRPG